MYTSPLNSSTSANQEINLIEHYSARQDVSILQSRNWWIMQEVCGRARGGLEETGG